MRAKSGRPLVREGHASCLVTGLDRRLARVGRSAWTLVNHGCAYAGALNNHMVLAATVEALSGFEPSYFSSGQTTLGDSYAWVRTFPSLAELRLSLLWPWRPWRPDREAGSREDARKGSARPGAQPSYNALVSSDFHKF